jgi:hypothetical protein
MKRERYIAYGDNERAWIDQFYSSLIKTLLRLELIDKHPLPTGPKWTRRVLYERLTELSNGIQSK